jgi:cytoskeletal protein CcmA (bactofilin family)
MDSSHPPSGSNGLGNAIGTNPQTTTPPHLNGAAAAAPVLNRRPILGFNSGRTGQLQTIAQQPSAAPESQYVSESGKSARLIVGPNIKLKGVEISDCEALVVEGVVEATLRAQLVQVIENGLLCGRVVAQTAEIRGEFRGDLTVHDRLIVYSTGRISGTIRYQRIKLEEGASLSGNIAPVNEGETLELPLES